MNIQQIKQFKGKCVCVFLNNDKNISGIVLQILENSIKLQTDFGIIQIKSQNINGINNIDQLKDLFVYVCKNQALSCKGIRLISSKTKINWPCKYFKDYQCSIKKVCNYNDIPLKIKNAFIDGMHSVIPVVGQLKK